MKENCKNMDNTHADIVDDLVVSVQVCTNLISEIKEQYALDV